MTYLTALEFAEHLEAIGGDAANPDERFADQHGTMYCWDCGNGDTLYRQEPHNGGVEYSTTA